MHQLKDDDGYKYFITPKIYFGANCETSGFFTTDESKIIKPDNSKPNDFIDTLQPIFECSDNSYMIPILDIHGGHRYKQTWDIDHPRWKDIQKDIPKKEELIKSTISQEDVVAEMIISLIDKQYGLNLEKVKELIGTNIDTRLVDELLIALKNCQEIDIE